MDNLAHVLGSLANALMARFEIIRNLDDFDEAITKYGIALQVMLPETPLRSATYNNMASALLARFERIGEDHDLDNVIVNYHAALKLRPRGDPDRFSSLDSLASALLTRFEKPEDRGLGRLHREFPQYPRAHANQPLQ